MNHFYFIKIISYFRPRQVLSQNLQQKSYCGPLLYCINFFREICICGSSSPLKLLVSDESLSRSRVFSLNE